MAACFCLLSAEAQPPSGDDLPSESLTIENQFDAVLAMYHDQGLIPFKSIAGDYGVNYTAGLPIVRTSPAHGTAYDIAGKGVANEQSFRQAIYLACDVYQNRMQNRQLAANALVIDQKE